MMEINGFEIEKYNQYGLPEGKTSSICPKCSHNRTKSKEKCMSLDWKLGMGTCHHCGEVIQLHKFKRKNDQTKNYALPQMPKSFELSEKVKDYFKQRGISERALKVAKVSEGLDWMPQFKKAVNTIHFNYFIHGVLVNVKYRGPQKSFKLVKDAEKVLSGIDRWKHEKELIICEGEIDELSYIEAGLNHVASVPNGATKKNQNLSYIDNSYEFLENKEKIYISVDNDEAGQALKKELVRRLGAERCYIIQTGKYKDVNELLISEGVEAIRKSYNNAESCPLENVETYRDYKQELIDFLKNGAKKGHQTGIDNLDKVFSTYTGQYIVVTGIPTHGKSEFVDFMCIGYAICEKMKIAYCSVENKPNYLHGEKLIKKLYGRAPNVNDIETNGFKLCEDFLDSYFYHIDFDEGYYLDDVLAKAAELVKRKGIKVLVIDPFNKVTIKGKARDLDSYVPEYLQKIDNFCRKFDVITILVAHPIKMKPLSGDKKPPMPTLYDVRGTGDFYDMAYHGLCVYRDFQEEIVTVKVLKCKFSHLGENGAEVEFAFNRQNGRYAPIEKGDNGETLKVDFYNGTYVDDEILNY